MNDQIGSDEIVVPAALSVTLSWQRCPRPRAKGKPCFTRSSKVPDNMAECFPATIWRGKSACIAFGLATRSARKGRFPVKNRATESRKSAASRTLGKDLRAIRKSRGLTLEDVCQQLGCSIGWLSQVERDLSTPSIGDLRQFARILGVPISLLFGEASVPPEEQGYVVRAGARRLMGSAAAGLTEELLSPDLTDSFEVIHSTFAPFSRIEAQVRRQTQEVGFVVNGRLNLIINERAFEVGAGDSFRIRDEWYTWDNPYAETAVVIWVISPPVY